MKIESLIEQIVAGVLAGVKPQPKAAPKPRPPVAPARELTELEKVQAHFEFLRSGCGDVLAHGKMSSDGRMDWTFRHR